MNHLQKQILDENGRERNTYKNLSEKRQTANKRVETRNDGELPSFDSQSHLTTILLQQT